MAGADTGAGEAFRQPLTWRGQAWRLALAVGVSLVTWATILSERTSVERAVDVGLGTLALALVVVRRRWPVTVAACTTALAAFSSLAAGPSTLAVVSLATGRRLTPTLAIGALSVLSGEVFVAQHPSVQMEPRWLTAAISAVCVSAMLAWGMYLGSRRELLWTLRRRAEVAEGERDLRAAQSRLEERARIAREMHDVLAHRISQIAVHAGALSYRTNLGVDEMRDGAGVIRESAHLALSDLRGVLGALRNDAGELLQNAPPPAYSDLADLVDEARRSGMRVEWTDRLSDEEVPDGIGRTIYRVVQEGLTNARKHAPGAAVDLKITGGTNEGITVVMRNPLGFERSSTPGAGLGLVGLGERTHLSGGTLVHGPEGRDFVLRAWAPWPPRTATPESTTP